MEKKITKLTKTKLNPGQIICPNFRKVIRKFFYILPGQIILAVCHECIINLGENKR